MFKTYFFSLVFTVLCLGASAWWGHHSGMGVIAALWITSILAILEVSLSFDNAIVNASILRQMSELWQKLFLTVGILIAVFGMRLLFPIVIVSVSTGMDNVEVVDMAFSDPQTYSYVLNSVYPMIASFGGSFLLMVFLSFVFDHKRETHWLGQFEVKLASLGKLRNIQSVVALFVAVASAGIIERELQYSVLLSCISGIVLFVIIDSLDKLFLVESEEVKCPTTGMATVVARNGLMGFLYLEVLDASFSFDGVIGAFAITRDLVIIMLGLAIGAMFVRSMTIDLVHRQVLEEYIYLEHGAMYAIGSLACIMMLTKHVHIAEIVPGLLGVAIIGCALWSSVQYKRRSKSGSDVGNVRSVGG